MTHPPRGRRRSPQRQARILDAAQALFTERGIDRTTLQDVAARAGVARQTLYSYFADKDALFAAVADRIRRPPGESTGDSLADTDPVLTHPDPLAALVGLAEALISRVTGPELSALRREVLANGHPALVQIWRDGGLGPLQARLTAELAARDDIPITADRAPVAAELFLSLVLHRPIMDSLRRRTPPADLVEHYHLVPACLIFLHGVAGPPR